MIDVYRFDKECRTRFLTIKARLAFAKLRQALSTPLIFHQFDSKYPIRIEINVSSYAIRRIFSDQNWNSLAQ